jgi:prepilin-type N-terminal cleavage/methylation domain-containing protein
MIPCRRNNSAFSLLELLIVIAVICILLGAILPNGNPSALDALRSAAQIVSTELAYGRSLAMANNSAYKFTFDIAQNRFILQHSGSNTNLDKLPTTPFSSPGDTLYQHVVDLDEFPHIGPTARIAAVTLANSLQSAGNIEFNPLGATTSTAGTVVWLVAGDGSNKRYITVTVDPVVGLSKIGNYSATGSP